MYDRTSLPKALRFTTRSVKQQAPAAVQCTLHAPLGGDVAVSLCRPKDLHSAILEATAPLRIPQDAAPTVTGKWRASLLLWSPPPPRHHLLLRPWAAAAQQAAHLAMPAAAALPRTHPSDPAAQRKLLVASLLLGAPSTVCGVRCLEAKVGQAALHAAGDQVHVLLAAGGDAAPALGACSMHSRQQTSS